MLTTDWTPIRRRLAVRRAPNRPPLRLRKSRHRAIVTPARATLAAGVAIGLGVALARAGRDLLAAREPTPDLMLAEREPLEYGLKRMALEQLDLVIDRLEVADASAPDEEAVHEMRKALKRLRSLLRMLEPALGKDAFARETGRLREVAQRLAGARDSKVMLATLEELIDRRPKTLAGSRDVQRLREQLAREHERIRDQTVGDAAERALSLGELRSCRLYVQAWELPACKEIELAEPGLRRLYGQGRERFRRARRGKHAATLAMHEWRKRVKDLRYATEMLRRREASHPPALPGRAGRAERRRRKQARRQSKLLRSLAKSADQLGEQLGAEHDLAVLAEIVRERSQPGASPRVGRRARKRLLKAIAKRRRKLRSRALREGERLYERKPRSFVRRIRAHRA